jgi:hypothetical protein
MLEVLIPFTFILGSVGVSVSTLAMSLVVAPLSGIDFSLGMCEDPLAISAAQAPVTFILCPILPLHAAEPMTEAAFPLSDISGASALINMISLYDGSSLIIDLLG